MKEWNPTRSGKTEQSTSVGSSPIRNCFSPEWKRSTSTGKNVYNRRGRLNRKDVGGKATRLILFIYGTKHWFKKVRVVINLKDGVR